MIVKVASSCEHAGHRERVRKKFIANGLDGFEIHEALELCLYYSIPRKDTNPIAHRILDKFGSLSAALDAPIDALTDSGISENTAVLLKLIPEMSRLYMEDKHNNHGKIIDFNKVADYLRPRFIGRQEECCLLLLTDAKAKEVFCGVITKGSINATDLPARKVVDYAMRYNAKCAVIVHNHPSGLALPSNEDIVTTENLYYTLKTVGVCLVDHILVSDDEAISFAESGICSVFANNIGDVD